MRIPSWSALNHMFTAAGMEFLQNHMKLKLLCFVLFFQSSSSVFNSASVNESYFIDCGSSNNSSFDSDNRVFIEDSKFLSDTSSKVVENPNPSPGSSLPYRTARIFTRSKSVSSYEFDLQSNNTHVVRLHFFPFASQDFDLSSAYFDVSVSGLPLLTDFNVKIANSIIKEYFLKTDSKRLVISFTPSRRSPSSFAFVNAIEVFSAPDNLIADTAFNTSGRTDVKGLLEKVLETVYRINIGGPKITPSNDTLGRTWIPDEDYLIRREAEAGKAYVGSAEINYIQGVTAEIAPENVYSTARVMRTDNTSMARDFNITWGFPVTSDYKYIVRLHFCDIVSHAVNRLYFNVYIGLDIAIPDLDLSFIRYQTLAAPYYKDFIVDPDISGQINISVGPSDTSSQQEKNAILNGVEIMKMDGVLGPIPGSKKHSMVLIFSITGGCLAFTCLSGVICLLALKCRRQLKPEPEPRDRVMWLPLPAYGESTYGKTTQRTQTPISPYIHVGLTMSFAEILSATDSFSKNLLIGSGGFGDVYKGMFRDGTKVAVKRLKPGSSQGKPEFLAEIRVLSKIRHRHLVSLIGHCEEQSEMILVYEFMENGSLTNHLYGTDSPCLSWKQRLEICIGAARGIHYLHTGSTQRIIHRDVKSTNILLDENFLAKVSDFGLSREVPSDDHTHVTTSVKGSFGYLDPEYSLRHQLTQKSDVYSFGVVLLEALCARPALDQSLPWEQVNLAEWALKFQKKGLLEQIVDPKLEGTINPNSLRKFGDTVEQCLARSGVDRPTMGDVLWNLLYALQLQESGTRRELEEDSIASSNESPLLKVRRFPSTRTTAERDYSGSIGESSDTMSSKVFSQLVSSEGR